jgi:N-acetylneuraminic acid mutarotase
MLRRPRFLLPLTALLVLLVAGDAAAATAWTTSPALMAQARWMHASAQDVAGTTYVFGGLTGAFPFTPTTSAEKFDGSTWSAITPLPAKRAQFGAALGSDNNIYIVGGFNSSGVIVPNVYRYDPVADSYLARAPLPTARSGAAVVADQNGLIYAIGGSPTGVNLAVARVDRYDPATNTWTQMASLPSPRSDGEAVLGADGDIYYFGGITNTQVGGSFARRTVMRYDTAANSWSTLPVSTPNFEAFNAAAQLHGLIYLMGAEANLKGQTVVNSFDPTSNTWTCVDPLPAGRAWQTADTRGDTLESIGGAASSGHPVRSVFQLALDATDTTTPFTRTAPTPSLVPGSTVATTAVPVRLSWKACDNGSSLDSYTVEQSEDGGTTWSPVTPATQLSTTIVQSFAPSGSVTRQARMSATDSATNTSTPVAGRAYTVRLFPDGASASVQYAGIWHIGVSPNYLGGRDHYSTSTAASVTLHFTGRQAGWVASKLPTSGSARVYADGHLLGTVSLHAATAQPRKLVFTHLWANTGAHTLKIVPATAGKRIDVDGFALLG